MELIKLFVGTCISGGLVLFLLGLIAGKHGSGLRRWGALAFAAAFAPAVFVGLLQAGGASVSAAASDEPIATTVAMIVAILVISGTAYVVLQLRKPVKPGGPSRLKMKRPYTHKSSPDLISFLKEQMRDRDEQ